MNFRTMEEFWPFYMNQHSKPATRRWHFAGTLASILCLIYSLCFNWWFVFFVPLFGYGLAWYSHFFVEKNFPATLGHPFWSLLCDFKMFGLMLTGQMDREIKRLGKRPMLQVLHALEVATKALGKITKITPDCCSRIWAHLQRKSILLLETSNQHQAKAIGGSWGHTLCLSEKGPLFRDMQKCQLIRGTSEQVCCCAIATKCHWRG